jgi:hypothetical protein
LLVYPHAGMAIICSPALYAPMRTCAANTPLYTAIVSQVRINTVTPYTGRLDTWPPR